MAKHRRRSRGSQLTQQAQLESQVRFAPQQDALQALQQQAQQQRDQAIQGSLLASEGIARAALAGRQSAVQDYGGAAFQQLGSQNFVRDQLAKLGPVADIIKAGAESEGQGARQRLQTMALGAMDELRSRTNRAADSADFNIQKALQDYGGNEAKLSQQAESLAGQQGLFTQERAGQLQSDAQKLAATLRGQNLTLEGKKISARTSRANSRRSQANTAASLAERTRHDLATEANSASGGSGAKKGKSLTPNQQSTRIAAIRQAQSLAGNLLRQGGHSKANAVSLLTQGFTVPTSGGKTRSYKAISAALAQAGVELATQGKIGAGTARRLVKEEGLHVHGKLPTMTAAETRAYRSRLTASRGPKVNRNARGFKRGTPTVSASARTK